MSVAGQSLSPVGESQSLVAASGSDEPALNGAMKAALLLLSLDERVAASILKQLDENEIGTIKQAVVRLRQTTPAQLAVVHREFRELLDRNVLVLRGEMDYFGKIITLAFGNDRAKRMLGTVRDVGSTDSRLDDADLEVLVPVLANEHPQVIAAVLGHVDAPRSAEILSRLPESLHADIMSRVACLKGVSPAALSQVERVLAAGLPPPSHADSEVDGIRRAAVLLNQLKGDSAENLLDAMPSEELATEIRRAMFTFEDLAALDRRGLQMLLKEVQSDQLMIALKTASDELREKIFGSLSKRAADMLKDDLEVMGPVRLAEVEQSQQAIVDVALQLRADGKLTIAGQGGEELV